MQISCPTLLGSFCPDLSSLQNQTLRQRFKGKHLKLDMILGDTVKRVGKWGTKEKENDGGCVIKQGLLWTLDLGPTGGFWKTVQNRPQHDPTQIQSIFPHRSYPLLAEGATSTSINTADTECSLLARKELSGVNNKQLQRDEVGTEGMGEWPGRWERPKESK